MVLPCYQNSGSQNWRLCPQQCDTDQGEEEGEAAASLCSPAWQCWVLPCLAPRQILVSGSLASSSLQQKSLNVVLGLCWFILSIAHLLLPPHFLPSVIHPLINLLACHVVSTCQMMITKKPGQLWSTAKVQEELCRTTFLQKAMSDTVWEVHSLIHSFSHFCIFYLFPIVLNKLCNWCYCTNQLFLSADNTSNVD